MDYKDHGEVLKCLQKAQEADSDNRDRAREAFLFVSQRGGQWEQYWWNANKGKPRYTFDLTSPIIDQIAGKLERADFDIKVRPADGDTSAADAKLFDGLIRTIENASNAKHIYAAAGRRMITGGIDGWQIVQEYEDADCFDQTLVIKPIANFLDSVFVDPSCKEQDWSDANYCFVLEAFTKADYDKRWPDRAGRSVSGGRTGEAYATKAEQVIIGQIYYIVEEPRTIVQTSMGRIFEKGPELDKVMDEMAMLGETIKRTRSRPRRCVYSRLFDGSDWLNEPQKTVFSYIPVIPVIANYSIFENKPLYWGVVEKLLDPQRVYNYAKSREVEEGALAPRAKYWMTRKQAAGEEAELATLNTNSDPVQFFTPDAENPGAPQQNGGAQVNAGLVTISESMRNLMGQAAGMFAASMGDNPGLQSGIAIEQLQEKGDIGTSKYFSAEEVAIAHTARILIDAIPKSYDNQRTLMLLGQDGTANATNVNVEMIDRQTRQVVKLNDLSRGKYSVTCTAGPSFRSRQQETVAAMTEVATIDPTVLQVGADILFSNIDAPGMDMIAQRKRQQLLMAGAIPQEQMTPQEHQAWQQAQAQPKQPDAATLLAQAEIAKAQAQAQRVQVQAQKDQQDMAISMQEGQQQGAKDAADIALKKQQLDLNAFQMEMDRREQQFNMSLKAQQQAIDNIVKQVQSLETIRKAMGVDAIVGPGVVEVFAAQVGEVAAAQQNT